MSDYEEEEEEEEDFMDDMEDAMEDVVEDIVEEHEEAQIEYEEQYQYQPNVYETNYVEVVEVVEQPNTVYIEKKEEEYVEENNAAIVPIVANDQNYEELKEDELISEEKNIDILQQPFNNPLPTMEYNKNFSNNIAEEAANTLRTAMKGWGTDEKKIINITSSYSLQQRLKIREMYTDKIGRDLIKDFKKELSGSFEKLVVALWLDYEEYDCNLINDTLNAMLGYNTDLLNELILTRTNNQINGIKKCDPKLVEKVGNESKKTFSSNNNYQTLLLNVLKGERPLNAKEADKKLAQADAETLNRYLNDNEKSVAKSKFVEIFCSRSWIQIRELSNIFQEISKKYTLNSAIKEAFGDNSDTGKGLCVLDEFSVQPYDYFSKKLKDCMGYMSTDDSVLIRIIVSRAEIDLKSISNIFGQRYGDGKTLHDWIKNHSSGDFEKLLLAICGFNK